jgi:hypothetical protein
MEQETFFSVIICTYNRSNLLSIALNSLINQTNKEWGAIVVDDGSEDNTFNVVKDYCDKFSTIKYIYQKHQGISIARNTGIFSSVGKYITFLDSDDEYKPNHLQIRYDILKNNPNIDLLHSGCEIIGNPFVPDKNDISKKIHLDDCVIGGTFFIKRELALKLGGFDKVDFSEDSAFFEKAMKAKANIYKCEDRTYIYHREYSDSICNKKM